jgi:nucleotide-binding universal stress UspA family protein
MAEWKVNWLFKQNKIIIMKKIIIALDYDPSAEKVAETGYEIAKALNAETVLLHVEADPSYYASAYSPVMGFTGFDIPAMEMPGTAHLHAEAKRFLEEVKKHLGDETIQTSVLDGDVTEAIMTVVNSLHADMVVMGTHSRRGFEKLLMGNLAESVLNKITVPLLAVPTHTEEAN